MAARSPETAHYSRVAMWLHWLIAIAIFYNLTSGLLHDTLPRGFFVFHISSGITILALSLVRIVWRLTHRPPPLLPMRPWEAKLAHGVHFLLYCAMVLLPFSGWALVSASPPAGSPGAAYAETHRAADQEHEHEHEAKAPDEKAPDEKSAEQAAAAPAPRKKGPMMVWGLFRLPLIAPVNRIGATPEGVPEQRELHEQIGTAHAVGGWVLLALLILHIGGALKHQFVDNEPELARMGLGHPGRKRA